MAKGLLVEEIVNWEGFAFEAVMIQLKDASEPVGALAYVTVGSHFQLSGFDVQFVEDVSRNVVSV